MSRSKPKRASFEFVPDDVLIAALKTHGGFVMHHIKCKVMTGGSCDCEPMMVGSGVDSPRARA